MKAMVLFSGGVDSTTALALAVEKYGAEEVLALSIFYGQKHKKELEAGIAKANQILQSKSKEEILREIKNKSN